MKEQKKKQMHTQNYREVPQFTTPQPNNYHLQVTHEKNER